MRAIDYGIQNFGDPSYKNTKSNVVVFNEAVNIGNDYDINSDFKSDYHFIEVKFINNEIGQRSIVFITDGEKISWEQFDYIKNSDIVSWREIDFNFSFENTTTDEVLIRESKIYEIEGKQFVKVAGQLQNFYIIEENRQKKNKPLILLNDILNDKSTSVIVFISDDGVKLERAYQNIECYNNEVVLFIENDFGSNLFGSVLRIKLGANITENSNFPASQTAKVINAFKLGIDIDTVTLSKAIKEEIENNEGIIHYIKKRFWATDKIVSVPVNFAFNTLKEAFDSISSGINSIKLEENRWRYYNEDGTKNEEKNLLFFNLNDFEKLEAKLKTNYHKKMFSSALKQLNNKNDEWKANIKTLKFDKENKYLHTYINDSINKIDNILKPTKDFLGNPEALVIENNKDTLIALNAFLVGFINGIIEIFKGLFDILSLLCQLFEGIRKGTSYLAQNLASLFSMFFEGIENFLDSLKNLFTKENLKALLQFIVQLPKLFLQLSIEGTNYLLNTDLKVPIDAFGYYIGYFIGMLVDIIISAIFTGGAKTVADVLKIISKQFTEIYKFAKSTLKYTSKVATNSIEYTIDLLAKLRNGAKNIKPFLEEILEWLRKLFDDIKSSNKIFNYKDVYKIKYEGRNLQNLVDEGTALAKYGKIGKQTVQEVNLQVQKLVNSLSKTKLEKCTMVSGMTYIKNGKISKTFTRHNFTKMNGIDEIGKLTSNGKFSDDLGNPTKYQIFLDEMHPTLRKRYDLHMKEVKKGLNADSSDIARSGIEASHGEIRALDDLLKEIDPLGELGDDVFKDIVGYNRYLREGANKIQPPCAHCHFLTTNVKYIGL
ncbi:hypothetical protein [Flavobacterium sp.]|uniref:hypothetical protein n=1 Tax=Flavobacterium sp. TaxID=239 RepID=UPI002FDD9070